MNSLTKAKILLKNKNGKTVSYRANKEYPLYDDIRNIIFKSVIASEAKQSHFITESISRGCDLTLSILYLYQALTHRLINFYKNS